MPARLANLLRRHGVALVALFIALGGTSFAFTARHGGGGGRGGAVILGCVGKNTGTLRVVDSWIRCGRLETPIAFNRHGRRGHTGHRGRPGKTGGVGAIGPQGARGPVGAHGPVGPEGAAGLDAVTDTAAEPAGANCATGGVKLMSGIDADRNATLDPGEVNDAATRYVCTGAKGDTGQTGDKGEKGDTGEQGDKGDKGDPGSPGAKGDPGATGSNGQSVTSATEAPGANCASGGVRYTSASGVSYVCNGAPGGGGSDTAAQVLGKLTTVDGSGSGLDADTLDGLNSSSLVQKNEFFGLFDSSFGFYFGTDNRTTFNDNPDVGSHYIGEVFLSALSFPLPGTAFAAGQVLPISGNSSLFSLLGTTYGGNGTTTFALPDLRPQAPGGLHYVIQTKGVFPSRP